MDASGGVQPLTELSVRAAWLVLHLISLPCHTLKARSLIVGVPLASWQFVALKFVSSNITYDILSLRTSFILPPANTPSIYTILSPVKTDAEVLVSYSVLSILLIAPLLAARGKLRKNELLLMH